MARSCVQKRILFVMLKVYNILERKGKITISILMCNSVSFPTPKRAAHLERQLQRREAELHETLNLLEGSEWGDVSTTSMRKKQT